MNDPLEKARQMEARRARATAGHRERMPEVARFVDLVRRQFGEDCALVWAREAGHEIGQRPAHVVAAVEAAAERAAILEFEAGFSRDEAERRAAAAHGAEGLL